MVTETLQSVEPWPQATSHTAAFTSAIQGLPEAIQLLFLALVSQLRLDD